MTTTNMAKVTVKGALLGASMLVGTALAAQEYPSRTVEVLHEYGPGGGTDRFIRAVADEYAKIVGQSMVPISIQGGGGVPAFVTFEQRPSDGYTLLSISPASVISHIQGRIDMDELLPLARVQYDQGLIWVGADSPYMTIQDLVAEATANPATITVGVSGAAGFDDVAMGLFAAEAGIELTTIPFSSSEMVSNTLGGQIDAMFEEFGPARGLFDSGDMRPLVVFAEERLPTMPDVPTARELGYEVTLGRWRAVAMHAEADPAHAAMLFGVIEQAVATETYKEYEEQNALQYRSVLMGQEEFSTFIDQEIETYTAVMKQLGYIE